MSQGIDPTVVMRICPFRQQPGDCGVWALSTFLSKPYSDVLLWAERLHPGQATTNGLSMEDLVRIARRFSVRLSHVQRVNLKDDTGLLGVTYHHPDHPEWPDHVVVLKRGQVLDAEGDVVMVWDVDAFFAHFRAEPDGFLRLPRVRGVRSLEPEEDA